MSDFKDNNYHEGITREPEDNDINLLDEDFTSTLYNKKNGGEPETISFDTNGNQKEMPFEDETQFFKDKEKEEPSENKDEPKKGYQPNAVEYKLVAKFMIELVDGGMSKLLQYLAKEKSSKQFELRAEKKAHLTSLMSEILEKHKIKMSIEIMFLIMFAAYYGPVAKTAYEMGQKKKQDEDDKSKYTKTHVQEQKAKVKEEVKKEVPVEHTNKYEKLEVVQEAEIVEETKEEKKTQKKEVKVEFAEDISNVHFDEIKETLKPEKKKRGRKAKEQIVEVEDVSFAEEGIERPEEE